MILLLWNWNSDADKNNDEREGDYRIKRNVLMDADNLCYYDCPFVVLKFKLFLSSKKRKFLRKTKKNTHTSLQGDSSSIIIDSRIFQQN